MIFQIVRRVERMSMPFSSQFVPPTFKNALRGTFTPPYSSEPLYTHTDGKLICQIIMGCILHWPTRANSLYSNRQKGVLITICPADQRIHYQIKPYQAGLLKEDISFAQLETAWEIGSHKWLRIIDIIWIRLPSKAKQVSWLVVIGADLYCCIILVCDRFRIRLDIGYLIER